MVTLHSLPKTTTRSNKRVGRGYGSGKGSHTASRGQKGQKSREKSKLLFEGTKTSKDFFRRVPMMRGKGKLKSFKGETIILKLSDLSVFEDGETVDVKALVKAGLVQEADASKDVKVLFDKKLDKKLTLSIPASKTVLKSLEG